MHFVIKHSACVVPYVDDRWLERLVLMRGSRILTFVVLLLQKRIPLQQDHQFLWWLLKFHSMSEMLSSQNLGRMNIFHKKMF